jgi:nicotinate-nucleotide adenylyltransferase
VLGGTFDPPHVGHLILAEQARDQLHLEKVLWVVAADPPHKQGSVHTSVGHRLELARLTVQDNPAFAVSLVDIARPGPHYSTDMLSLLKTQHLGAQLYFLIGSDSLRDLPSWHEPHNLVELARLAVMRRPGVDCDLGALESAIPGIGERLTWVDAPYTHISARDIRKRVREQHSIRYLVAESVRDYIAQQCLYRDDG